MNYSKLEVAVMHYGYGLAGGIGEQCRHICHLLYPNLALPDNRTFSNLHHRLIKTGTCRKGTSEGRLQCVRTPEIEEKVL